MKKFKITITQCDSEITPLEVTIVARSVVLAAMEFAMRMMNAQKIHFIKERKQQLKARSHSSPHTVV